ncbi:MAG TPA: hypothetical protein VK939_10120 [Longimicrobiales bacterium]|nr:hypothetical protein [Longimicrobiales bacterium]
MSKVTCGFCHTRFDEDYGQRTCGACPLRGGCSFVRCPQCGFENPTTPEWVSKLRSWLRTDAADLLAPYEEHEDERELAVVP